MNASEACEKLYRLLDGTAAAHEPVLITGPRSNGVLVGEEDWNAIQETLHLFQCPACASPSAQDLRRRWMSARKNRAGDSSGGLVVNA